MDKVFHPTLCNGCTYLCWDYSWTMLAKESLAIQATFASYNTCITQPLTWILTCPFRYNTDCSRLKYVSQPTRFGEMIYADYWAHGTCQTLGIWFWWHVRMTRTSSGNIRSTWQGSSPINHHVVANIWGLWCKKQVSQAGISNYIPQFTVGCNYLSLPGIPASGEQSLYVCAGNMDMP